MAVRPARKDPISTRPIYLPVVPSKELTDLAPRRPKAAAANESLALYSDVAETNGLDLNALAAELEAGEALRQVQVLGDFFASQLMALSGTERRDAVAAAASALAWARVRSPRREEYRMMPLRGEIDNEKARLHARLHPGFGDGGRAGGKYGFPLFYDGAAVRETYREILERSRSGAAKNALILTDRRLAGWEPVAHAWQLQPSVLGSPLVISLPTEPLPPRLLAEAVRKRLSPAP